MLNSAQKAARIQPEYAQLCPNTPEYSQNMPRYARDTPNTARICPNMPRIWPSTAIWDTSGTPSGTPLAAGVRCTGGQGARGGPRSSQDMLKYAQICSNSSLPGTKSSLPGPKVARSVCSNMLRTAPNIWPNMAIWAIWAPRAGRLGGLVGGPWRAPPPPPSCHGQCRLCTGRCL